MFDLLYNKNFSDFCDYNPFLQIYYVFYKKILEVKFSRVINAIRLHKIFKIFIGKKRLDNILELGSFLEELIEVLEKRISKNFKLNPLELLSGRNTTSCRDFIRIFIIAEIFNSNLKLIKDNLKRFKNFQNHIWKFDDLNILQPNTSLKQLYKTQKNELKKLVNYIKNDIIKSGKKLLNKNSQLIPDVYNIERSWILNIYKKTTIGRDKEKFQYINYDIANIKNNSNRIRLDRKNIGKISQFPRQARTVLSEIFYYLIVFKQIPKQEVVKRIIDQIRLDKLEERLKFKFNINEFEEIGTKLNQIDYSTPITNYLKDLVEMVYRLEILNKSGEQINFSKFIRKLFVDGYNLGSTERSLEKVIHEIYKHLVTTFKDIFNLTRIKRVTTDLPKSEKRSIELLYKKFKLSNEIYDGLFKGECVKKNCSVNFKQLPALEFHHANPKIKKSTFNEIAFKKYNELKFELSQQQVELICNNCHSGLDSKIYNEYEFIIMRKDLFIERNGIKKSSKDVNELIDREIVKKLKKNNNITEFHSRRYDVKVWIKKRFIIEELFDGKCVNCGEIRLPSLEFHHVDPDLKKHVWRDIHRTWSIKKIISNFIIKEKCVCLCANCHSMQNTRNFRKHAEKIIGSEYKHEVEQFYKELDRNIELNLVKENYDIDFEDPLKLMFEKGDTWKEVLIYIYYIALSKGDNIFSLRELQTNIGKHVKVKHLLENGYITLVGKSGNTHIYRLTNKGLSKAETAITKFKEDYFISYNELEKFIVQTLKNNEVRNEWA